MWVMISPQGNIFVSTPAAEQQLCEGKCLRWCRDQRSDAADRVEAKERRRKSSKHGSAGGTLEPCKHYMNYPASLLASRHSLAEPNEVAGVRAGPYRQVKGPAPGVEGLCAHFPAPLGFLCRVQSPKALKSSQTYTRIGLLSRCSGPWVRLSSCPLFVSSEHHCTSCVCLQYNLFYVVYSVFFSFFLPIFYL